MHIFLTGEIGVGKSTVIDAVMAGWPLRCEGFRTSFGPGRASPGRKLFLYSASAPPAFDDAHAVVRAEHGGMVSISGRFDALGAPLIERAARCAGLIIMDECGVLEQEEKVFQRAVLGALDGSVPVLGVVRLGAPGWTRGISEHPRVRVITVTGENRDGLPPVIIKELLGEGATE